MSNLPQHDSVINILPDDGYSDTLDKFYAPRDVEHIDSYVNNCSDPASTRTTAEIAKDLEEKATKQLGKTKAVKQRRRQFNSDRARLVLLLIESGVAYVCSDPDCCEHTDLTVDHKMPLSRGGSDGIDNLQFLCGYHNSVKGDRVS